MALIPPDHLKLPRHNGYTMLELIIAMGLTIALFGATCGVYLHFHNAFFSRGSVRQIRMEAELFEKLLSDLIIEGKGIIYMSQTRLILTNKLGGTIDFKYDQNRLNVNGALSSLQFNSFVVKAYGPYLEYGDDPFSYPADLPIYAELDEDKNGQVDMEELDIDRSNDLGPAECAMVDLITINAEIEGRGELLKLSIQAHPRSRIAPTEALLDEYYSIY